MPDRMNDLFRSRALEFHTQKAIDEIKPIDYLRAALDSDSLAKALAKTCRVRAIAVDEPESNRPGQRFINMIHRDDDVSRWVGFLRHEQNRTDSPWQGDILAALPEKLLAWHQALPTDNPLDAVVCQVKKSLENIVSELTPEERMRIGLRAFRSMIWRLRSGGEE